jgi:hypothetical protein
MVHNWERGSALDVIQVIVIDHNLDNIGEFERIIHQEIDRQAGRFHIALSSEQRGAMTQVIFDHLLEVVMSEPESTSEDERLEAIDEAI